MLRRKDDFMKRYQKFKDDLRGEIISGRIKPNEFILPENTLSEQYQLSRVSIRKVLAELVEEGLIEKISGKGNRVLAPINGLAVRETIKLAWFSTSYEIDIVREIVNRYQASQPFADVELSIIPESGYMETLVQLIENGEGPDVFMVSDSQFRQLLDLEKAHLIEPYISPELEPETDSYPKIYELFHLAGEPIITPFLFSPVVICYNESLFDQAGIGRDHPIHNWDALVQTAKKLTADLDEDDRIEHYGFCFSSSPHRWPVFMLQNDGSLASSNQTLNLDNANTIEALQFCLDLMYKEKVSPIYSHGSEYLAESLFVKERVAMILSTYYFMNEFRGSTLRWNVRPVPKEKSEGTLLLGGGLAINKNSQRLKLAQSFTDYMVGAEAQTLLKRLGCTIPARREIAEDDALLNPQIHPKDYNIFKDILPYAKTLLELNLSSSEVNLLRDEMQLMWMNMESPQDACSRIEDLIHHQRKK
ncbi:extracellular solute-binding protein [Paenibacillus sp. EZ-K15]|uniref:extracellular solute-binding protein n=1 Tax=Paenibacillus sp. EZ-K15 TaxID=2044275 RepID=UPI000BF33051|nr:extracellular solute-binding protein [Paenibacillus sp. EZ-K15]